MMRGSALYLMLGLLGFFACQAQPPHEHDRSDAKVGAQPTRTSPAPTLGQVEHLGGEHRWNDAAAVLTAADPDADAEQTFAAGDTRFLVSGGYGYFTVPGVPDSESLYDRRDEWRIVPGTTDAFESQDHVAFQAPAQAYMVRFNRRLATLKTEK